MSDYGILIIIIFCSVIQSMFGVGLLLFGTPALILYGLEFKHALMILLPCSILINLMQIIKSWNAIHLKRHFIIYCLPAVILGMFTTFYFEYKINIRSLIGVLMLATATIRLSIKIQGAISTLFKRVSNLSLFSIGLLHGLTNMGGGLLTLFFAQLHKEKVSLRSHIAFGYLLMASCQLIVLLYFDYQSSASPSAQVLVYPLVTLLTYFTIGNRLFWISSEKYFQYALTAFIIVVGLFMLIS